MQVALVQMYPRLGDVDHNLSLVADSLERSAARGAEVAVFPELALTGYRLRDLVPQVAVRLDRAGPVLDRLRELSREMPFLIGLVEEAEEHRFFNSAAYFDDGDVVHVHRKCYLPTYGMFDEAMDFAPGERLRAFSSRLGRGGVLICEDAWHPASATVMTQEGATFLFILSASPLRGLGAGGTGLLSDGSWRELVRTVARYHTVPIVCVHRAGYEDGLAFSGASFACGPGGEMLAEARPSDPDLIVVKLDPEKTRAARAAYPLVRDERPELIARELLRTLRIRAGEDPR